MKKVAIFTAPLSFGSPAGAVTAVFGNCSPFKIGGDTPVSPPFRLGTPFVVTAAVADDAPALDVDGAPEVDVPGIGAELMDAPELAAPGAGGAPAVGAEEPVAAPKDVPALDADGALEDDAESSVAVLEDFLAAIGPLPFCCCCCLCCIFLSFS